MEPLIVYIIGLNRSGSTLLDNILSYHSQAISVGELHNLQGYYNKTGLGSRQDWLCSCNCDIKECSFWSKILRDTSFTKEFKTKLEKSNYYKTDYLGSYFIKNNFQKNIEITQNNQTGKVFASNIWALYKSIFQNSKKNIIIDSSKEISEAYYINKYKKNNIKFLLIERDIWEVVFSKRKRIASFSKEYKQKMCIEENSIYKDILLSFKKAKQNRVLANNVLSKKGNDLMTIDYRYLTKNPIIVSKEISDFLEITPIKFPATMGVESQTKHTIHGSPSRFERKEIKPDERWREFYRKNKLPFWWAKLLQSFL